MVAGWLIVGMLSVYDPGSLHDLSAHAHNEVVENVHAQMMILFCDLHVPCTWGAQSPIYCLLVHTCECYYFS